MFCPNCGLEFSGPDLICPSCGADAAAYIREAGTMILDPESEAAPEEALPEEDAGAPLPPDAPAGPEADGLPEEDAETAADPEAGTDGPETANESETPLCGEDGPAPESEPDDPEGIVPEDPENPEPGDGDADAEEFGEAGTEPAPKKKHTAGIVIGVVVALVAVIIACVAIVLHQRSGKSSVDGAATAMQVTDESGAIVAEIDNEQFNFYYWGEYFYFVQNYGFHFDASVPLSEQSYDDDRSWEDYFVESAGVSIQQTMALKLEAEAAGFAMPEEYQAQYDATLASLADYAADSGFTDEDGNGDVLGYVQDSYGATATVEGFGEYLYDSYYVSAYSNSLYDESLTFTDEELADYYDENADTYAMYGISKSDQEDVSVRHILISPEELGEDATEEDQTAATEAAEAEAERIYEEWRAGEATEESFAEMANTYSQDPGSDTNGGLYEDVYPGQMVPEFDEWCFDESRQPGDTGIVKTDYGYHIMYFVGANGTYYWKSVISEELLYDRYLDAIDAITEKYAVTVTDKMALTTPDAVKAIMEENAAETAGEDSAAG